MPIRDLIIVGAGPSGLSAAIASKQRGLDYQVIEQGALVNSIFHFPPQMVFFTTPELLEIGGLPFVSPYEKPTRAEALRYYRKVVDTYDLQIAFEETVLSVGIDSEEPRDPDEKVIFAVETRSARGIRRIESPLVHRCLRPRPSLPSPCAQDRLSWDCVAFLQTSSLSANQGRPEGTSSGSLALQV